LVVGTTCNRQLILRFDSKAEQASNHLGSRGRKELSGASWGCVQ
jgi:hypothetical protein